MFANRLLKCIGKFSLISVNSCSSKELDEKVGEVL